MRAPIACAAMTPAAGPDSIVETGRAAARPTDITPPLDSMMCTGATTPIPPSRFDSSAR